MNMDVQKKQVWIVEDEVELAHSYSDFLEDQFKLQIFTSAEAALEHFEQNQTAPDMVLSDIRMPGMDGMAFVETLRAKGMQKPVVMVSGYAQKKDLLRANELKISSFLEKPCAPENLRNTIKGAIQADELATKTEELLSLLTQQAQLFEEIISKCVDRYAHAENLLEDSKEIRFADRNSIRTFLEKIYAENKMHRELHALQEKISSLRSEREKQLPKSNA